MRCPSIKSLEPIRSHALPQFIHIIQQYRFDTREILRLVNIYIMTIIQALPDIFSRLYGYASIPEILLPSEFSNVAATLLRFDSSTSSVWLIGSLSTAIFLASTFFFYRFMGKNLLPPTKLSVRVPLVGDSRSLTVSKLIPYSSAHYWFQHLRHSTSEVSKESETSTERALRRQLTSIGRFALRSQTKRNPCIITFFVAMSNKKGQKDMDGQEFNKLWGNRVMTKHERFRSRICAEDDRYFEVIDKEAAQYMAEVSHPNIYRKDLQERIEEYLTSDLKLGERLWEGQLSTGPIGASGAISHEQISGRHLMDTCDTETLALYRVHHALADGVSMSVVLADASDEAEVLDSLALSEVNKRRRKNEQRSIFEKIVLFFWTLVLFYIVGGIKALVLQAWRIFHSVNPFDDIIANSNCSAGQRSVSWRVIGSVDEMKKVAKAVSNKTTINDVSVFIVTSAIKRQLAWHYKQIQQANKLRADTCASTTVSSKMPSHVNVCVPVHLLGGTLFDPKTGDRVSLGNKIGAFVAAIPLGEKSHDRPAAGRLKKCSAALNEQKNTPAPLIAWRAARFFSDYAPDSLAKFVMRHTNGQSAAVVSNVKGFPFQTHWHSRSVEFLCAFLPLPPGIPIGIVVQSYSGEMSFSVDADKRAVPDAGRFADWMLEEYQRLKKEAGV